MFSIHPIRLFKADRELGTHQPPAPLTRQTTSNTLPARSGTRYTIRYGQPPIVSSTSSGEASSAEIRPLSVITSFGHDTTDTNRAAAQPANTAIGTVQQVSQGLTANSSPAGVIWWSADSRDPPPQQDNPTRATAAHSGPPDSAKSYLFTPESANCSTPPGWEASLPKEPLTLTFGIELEHIFGYTASPSPEYKWLLEPTTPIYWQEESPREDDNPCIHGDRWSTNAAQEELPEASPRTSTSRCPWDNSSALEWNEGDTHLEVGETSSCCSYPETDYEGPDSLIVQRRILTQSNLACDFYGSSSRNWDLKRVSFKFPVLDSCSC